MKAILQRVTEASVTIDGKVHSEIQEGLLVLLGVGEGDREQEAELLAKKTAELRIFSDENDKMNLSVMDIGGSIVVVSNFTLYADCSHGRRPSFMKAGAPKEANRLYEYYVRRLKQIDIKEVKTGMFGADMKVRLLNDGPVTVILDTKELKQ